MMVSRSAYLPVKWVCCFLPNSQRIIIMKHLPCGLHKYTGCWSQFWGTKMGLSHSSPQGSTVLWGTMVPNCLWWHSIDTNLLHMTCSPDQRRKNLSGNVHKQASLFCFSGSQTLIYPGRKINSEEGTNSALKEPSSAWAQKSSFQGRSVQTSQPQSCLCRLLGGLLGPGSSEASQMRSGFQGVPLCSWAF